MHLIKSLMVNYDGGASCSSQNVLGCGIPPPEKKSERIAKKAIKISVKKCSYCDVDVVFCVQRMRSFAELRGVQYIHVLAFTITKESARPVH